MSTPRSRISAVIHERAQSNAKADHRLALVQKSELSQSSAMTFAKTYQENNPSSSAAHGETRKPKCWKSKLCVCPFDGMELKSAESETPAEGLELVQARCGSTLCVACVRTHVGHVAKLVSDPYVHVRVLGSAACWFSSLAFVNRIST